MSSKTGSPRKSPKKMRPSTAAPELEHSLIEAQTQAQHHQFNVAARDVEIERMKITIDGLNHRVKVGEDYVAEGT